LSQKEAGVRPIALFIALAAIAPIPGSVAAQPAAQAAATVDGLAVASEVKRLLAQHYVLPELRTKFAAVLDKGISSGRYDGAQAAKLVELINADLATVTPDKHLGLMYDPEASKQLASGPPNAGADDAAPTPDEIAAAERRNHGIIQLKILPGNIRYLESDGFVWAGASTERAYDDAVRFLAGGDAVIIDMRKNGGGSPDAVRYLTSHFTKPNTPLMTFYMGSRGTDKSVALPALRAPSLAGKPLYVLTGGGSASAAEEFIGHVAGYKLGELVGERTAGAGFRNEFFALPGGMVISISVGQAILASTGKGWEAVGFTPNVEAPLAQALDVATVRALRKVAETAPPPRAKSLLAVAAVTEAKVKPVKTALPAAAYAGTFGERVIKAEGDKLVYQRAGGPTLTLVAIGPNQFAFAEDPMATVAFDLAGNQAVALHLVRGDGSKVDAPRNP
jgi:hypothetical protein